MSPFGAGSFLGVQFHPEKSGPAGLGVSRPMPLARLIPCLDVAHGRVVKGVNFVGLRDVGDPVELAQYYSDGGADELVLLDITATPEDARHDDGVVADVADVLEIPFTVGGGVRSRRGRVAAHRVRRRPRLAQLGRAREPVTHHRDRRALRHPRPWSSRSTRATASCTRTADEWPRPPRPSRGRVEASERGAGEILLTSISHDGRR